MTDNDANLDKESGGLVVYTTKPPDDCDFVDNKEDTARVKKESNIGTYQLCKCHRAVQLLRSSNVLNDGHGLYMKLGNKGKMD